MAPAVVSEKNVMKEAQRDNILKFVPLLRDPLYKLDKAANHLEMWLHGVLPRAPLLDVSAWLRLSFHSQQCCLWLAIQFFFDSMQSLILSAATLHEVCFGSTGFQRHAVGGCPTGADFWSKGEQFGVPWCHVFKEFHLSLTTPWNGKVTCETFSISPLSFLWGWSDSKGRPRWSRSTKKRHKAGCFLRQLQKPGQTEFHGRSLWKLLRGWQAEWQKVKARV